MSPKNRILYAACLMLLFWSLYNGIISYTIPIMISGLGYSATLIGLIIASSNVFGAIYDFVLTKFIPNTSYRRLFLYVSILCLILPLVMWVSKTIPLLLISMAIWGLYGDLNDFAEFDFVSRRSSNQNHSQYFGILGIFQCIGSLLGPIVAGLVITERMTFMPFSLAYSFILMSIIFFIILIDVSPKKDAPDYDHHAKYTRFNFINEFKLLGKISKILLPVIIFQITIYVFDSVFWVIGPLYSQSFPNFKDFGGIFMSAYTFPTLIVNWYIKPLTVKFGKKRTAYFSFIAGCLLLLPLTFIDNPYLIILLVFLSSIVNSIAWPAIHGACADYISESPVYEKEIQSVNDFSVNIGYIIGPASAGILADIFGMKNVFLILSSFCILVVCYLLVITPKHINVVIHRD